MHGTQTAAVLRSTAVHSAGTTYHQSGADRLAVSESRLRVPRQRSHQVGFGSPHFTILQLTTIVTTLVVRSHTTYGRILAI